MQKSKIIASKENAQKNITIEPKRIKNYFISLIFKIISVVIILILLIIQIECLLIFIIQLISNNIYYIIILLLIVHLIFIRFIVQSLLYVLHCPFLDSICFYTISCNQIRQLFISTKDFISLYQKIQKKNKTIEQKDIAIIDEIANIINSYLFFFKILKKNGKLSQTQNIIYERLEMWMKTFEDYKNYLESLNNNDKKEILNENKNQNIISYLKRMAIDSNIIKKILIDFLGDNYELFSFKNIYNCLINKDFFNIEQFSILFHKRFNNTYKFFITSDNQIIDYTIISYEKLNKMYKNKRCTHNFSNDQEMLKKNLLLYCNPNGMIYQLFTPDKFLPFLEGGCDILLWNYRGYGSSTGYPTFKNAKNDALELFDFVKKKYTQYNKFGVYGYSVGGGSAMFIANQRQLDVLICDRNFTNVCEIVKNIPYVGWLLFYLVKILNFKYDYNINQFIESKNNNICKVVLCDPDDEIIPNSASLKSGISKYIIKKYCEEHKMKIKENVLDLFLETKEDLRNKFIEALLNISSILQKFDENPFMDIIPDRNKKSKNKDKKNLNDFLLLNISDNFKADKKYFKNILIKTIIKFFNSFKFSSENLEEFKKKDETRLKKLFIDVYFNNFIIWGSISDEKIIDGKGFTNPFTLKNNIKYLNNAIKNINVFLQDKIVKNFENVEDYRNIVEHLNIIKKCLEIITNKTKEFDYEKKINIGSLIRLNCGHNGNFSESDEQNLIDILKDVKFIY